MPHIHESIDYLPHIDTSLSEAEIEAAKSQVADELSSEHSSTHHPRVAELCGFSPNYSPLVKTAHDAIAQNNGHGVSSNAIDKSRYEALEAPEDENDVEAWKMTIKRAYTASSYLESRSANLKALEAHGKNAWLISNSQVEDDLRRLEGELKETKRKLTDVSEERRIRQDNARGEMEGLEETWKKSLGRAIEAEVAIEGLRNQVLDKRRKLANGEPANG